ncbi:MAG: hypothetical protein KGY66_03495 [Candidatus Thermoplasmatota archaeon]|nr:hypothetical protein [Candidatus Thermoplasmatota archaeon]
MMEEQIFSLIGLYFIYYLVIPGTVIFIILKIKQKRDFINVFKTYWGEEKEGFDSILKENKKQLKNLQILLVIFILISMPLLNVTFYGLQDISIHSTRFYKSGNTIYPAHIDLVDEQIGPTFDKEDAIERMEEDIYGGWYLDDIRDQIDLDKLIRSPGRITIYKLKSTSSHPERVVITHAYLSPIPITRSIEFIVLEKKAFLETDNIIVYPMPPSIAAPS